MYLRTDNSFTARGRLVSAPNYNISKSGNVVTSIRLAQETPFKDKTMGDGMLNGCPSP